MKIQGATFLVTGSSSGLGEATARRLHAGGGNVVLADLNEGAGGALAAELGARARFVRTDVASEADGRAAVAAATEGYGALHGLVNCAGIATGERVLGRDGPHRLESFVRTLTVNLVGSFNMLRLAAEAMQRHAPSADEERGVIVNTASVAAFEGQIGQAAYAASKGGVAAMTLPVARELARVGIRVVTIAPGLFATPMVNAMPPQVQESLVATTLFPHRLGAPEEYAALVEHIVGNVMLNGSVLRLDGAVRLPAR